MKNCETAFDATNSGLVMHPSDVQQNGPPCGVKADSSHDLTFAGHSPTIPQAVWLATRGVATLATVKKALTISIRSACYVFATLPYGHSSQLIDFTIEGRDSGESVPGRGYLRIDAPSRVPIRQPGTQEC
jgi:hypothetical protein